MFLFLATWLLTIIIIIIRVRTSRESIRTEEKTVIVPFNN